MENSASYKIYFVNDSAAAIDFGNVIDKKVNTKAIALFNYLTQHPVEGMIEAIPAYSSVAVYFDIPLLRKQVSSHKKVYEWIQNKLNQVMLNKFTGFEAIPDLVRIPVCYDDEFGNDLSWMTGQKNLTREEIIHLHSSRQYRVYMLGFLPGFPYMGEVDKRIIVPRKPEPQPILAGSVGIAGKQTGIYPLNSPGGWQIIGRTPLKMFDKNKIEPCLLKAGDAVEFYSIAIDEFNYMLKNPSAAREGDQG
jgi:inhibitor of KinA